MTNPIEIPIIVPDFLKAECKLCFAHIDNRWYYGYEIKGRVERSRRVRTLLTSGWADMGTCLHDLSTMIEEGLKADKSRLADFLVYKIDAAAKAVEGRDATLAEAMGEEVHFPAYFSADSATEGTEVGETPETAAEEKPGSVETLRFKARGVRQCDVTLRLGRDGEGRYRCGWNWNVGNYGWVCPVENRPTAASRSQCLEEARQVVLQSIAKMEITGTADQRRAVESRRDTLSEQFDAWMDEQIGSQPEAVDDQDGDSDGDDE